MLWFLPRGLPAHCAVPFDTSGGLLALRGDFFHVLPIVQHGTSTCQPLKSQLNGLAPRIVPGMPFHACVGTMETMRACNPSLEPHSESPWHWQDQRQSPLSSTLVGHFHHISILCNRVTIIQHRLHTTSSPKCKHKVPQLRFKRRFQDLGQIKLLTAQCHTPDNATRVLLGVPCPPPLRRDQVACDSPSLGGPPSTQKPTKTQRASSCSQTSSPRAAAMTRHTQHT